MSHQPLALKYRPATFADVISQEHVTRTLQNALDAGRTAQAYLFAGPRGSGKTTTARLLAKALNCDRGVTGEPCGECANCETIAVGRSLDVIEIDAASNRGIDDVKELREAAKYAPAQGRYKVYIIDEVHQLSKDAFNALLKTLEEPPRHVVFVLATTEPHRIPATILSRCQRFDFRPIPLSAIRARLADIAARERIQLEEEAEFAIAKKADGSLRDALSLLDQVVAFGGVGESASGSVPVDLEALRRLIGVPDEERYLELTGVLAAGDAERALRLVGELRSAGYDLEEFYTGFLEHLRNCLLFTLGNGAALAEVPERYHGAYATTARSLGTEDLLRMMTLATDEEQIFRRSSQQALVLEVLLVRLALLDRTVDLEPLLADLEDGGAGPGRRRVRDPSASTQRPRETASGSTDPGSTAAKDTATAKDTAMSQAELEGPLTLDLLLATWDDVMESVHATRPTVAALLREARPAACTPEQIVLELPAGAEFRREQLAAGGMLDPLAGVLSRRWSFAGTIRLALPDPAGPATSGRPTRPNGRDLAAREVEASLQDDPMLRQVVALFGANVIRVHPSAGS